MEVDQAFVDPHLEAVPSVRTLTGRCLTGRDPKLLRGHTDGTTDVQLLFERRTLEVGTDLLEVRDVTRSQRNTDTVDDFVGGCRSGIFLGWEGHLDNRLVFFLLELLPTGMNEIVEENKEMVST